MVTSWGTAGDIRPFLGIAAGLQARGHRVTFLVSPVHETLVKQAGFVFRPMGTNEHHQAAMDDPDLWDERKAFGVVWRSLRPSLGATRDLIAALPREDRCWVLAHPITLPAAAIARTVRRDLQIVGAYLAPSNLRTCHDPMTVGSLRVPAWVPPAWRRWIWRQVDARMIDPVFLPDLNTRREAVGLAPVRGFIHHMQGAADLSLTLFPTWFGAPQPDWPSPVISGAFPLHESRVGEILPPELNQFLADGDAPIVFTPGTGHRHASAYFASALAATMRLGRRAIFLTPHREQIPSELPDTVLWQAHAPFRALLPRAEALVHHGGIGTTAEALRAGIPQLIVPFAFDQFDNGVRVRELGVGECVKASRASPRRLAKVLGDVLSSSSLGARCAAVAEGFAGDKGLDALCGELDDALAVLRRQRDRPAGVAPELAMRA
ncbi:glycosyltransferase [Aquabacterium sp. A7-Y]|uniref:glycosyltransferase n=1 Tax=Aquabacterium sp. A7-Y TaxID=1349605 RepID=UPI0039FDDB4A